MVLAEGGVSRSLGLQAAPEIDLSTLVQLPADLPVVVRATPDVARAAVAAGANGGWVTLDGPAAL